MSDDASGKREGETSETERARRVVDLVETVLGSDLVGAAYLYGSAAIGGLRPHSGIDVFAVGRRPTTPSEKRRLVDGLLAVSGAPRPVELTVVDQSDVGPWRCLPRLEFQYGDWWRAEFGAGELTPWTSPNADLASLFTMVLLADTPLLGPPPSEVLDPVPRDDYVRALGDSVDELRDDLDFDTRNVSLTLARVWSSHETRTVRSNDGAADWALDRLSTEQRLVLARARAVSLREEGDQWDDVRPATRAYADYVVMWIERLAPTA